MREKELEQRQMEMAKIVAALNLQQEKLQGILNAQDSNTNEMEALYTASELDIMQIEGHRNFGIKLVNDARNQERIINNTKHILSRKQLLERLWDSNTDYVDENAVAVNIRRLREKIEPDPSNPVYIKNVRGLGYVWEMECERQ